MVEDIILCIVVLVWAIYFLATHQDMQEKCYQDVKNHYKGGPITADAMKNMKYVTIL